MMKQGGKQLLLVENFVLLGKSSREKRVCNQISRFYYVYIKISGCIASLAFCKNQAQDRALQSGLGFAHCTGLLNYQKSIKLFT